MLLRFSFAFYCVYSYDRTEVMRILVQDYKALVDPLAVGGDEKWTPLHEAV